MPYCTIQDVRNAGITVNEADDATVTSKITEASELIDRYTRQFFEERTLTVELTGSGLADLKLPVPPITITKVTVDDDEQESTAYKVIMPTMPDSRMRPKLRMIDSIWSEGSEVSIEGTWGYVDDPGGTKTTPILITRACVKLVIFLLNDMSSSSVNAGAIVEEKYKDYSYRLAEERLAIGSFGDAEIDQLLAMFTKRTYMAV